jgi:hypothetical protein
MSLKRVWIVLAVLLLCTPQLAGAATVLEETDFIFGFSGKTYSFVADMTSAYEVTLTDFEFPGPFDILGVAITTSTESVGELLAPGSRTFGLEMGNTYFANVLGRADDELGAGLFGIKVSAVPIPSALMLLGSGILGLFVLKRKSIK